MSEFSDKYHRSVALEKAHSWAAITYPRPSAERVLEVAEKFRAFLAGETAEEPESKASSYRPSWIYFKFRDSDSIYYRADINKGAHDREAVERKGYAGQTWTSNYSSGNPKTRAELREREDYTWAPRIHVPAAYLK